MSVIKTERNFVCELEPLPPDRFVETWLVGAEGRYCLLTQTIDRYGEAVAWAVSMADQMENYIEVVPITDAEFLERNSERVDRAVASMGDQERGELRQLAVKACAEVMRDSDDPALRAQAYDALVKLRLVRA